MAEDNEKKTPAEAANEFGDKLAEAEIGRLEEEIQRLTRKQTMNLYNLNEKSKIAQGSLTRSSEILRLAVGFCEAGQVRRAITLLGYARDEALAASKDIEQRCQIKILVMESLQIEIDQASAKLIELEDRAELQAQADDEEKQEGES